MQLCEFTFQQFHQEFGPVGIGVPRIILGDINHALVEIVETVERSDRRLVSRASPPNKSRIIRNLSLMPMARRRSVTCSLRRSSDATSRGGAIVSASVCTLWLITSPNTAPEVFFRFERISSKSGSSSSPALSGAVVSAAFGCGAATGVRDAKASGPGARGCRGARREVVTEPTGVVADAAGSVTGRRNGVAERAAPAVASETETPAAAVPADAESDAAEPDDAEPATAGCANDASAAGSLPQQVFR